MGPLWLTLLLLTVVGLAFGVVRLLGALSHASSEIDLGTVSSSWLVEHRIGEKENRFSS
jgi:hypothetical protein